MKAALEIIAADGDSHGLAMDNEGDGNPFTFEADSEGYLSPKDVAAAVRSPHVVSVYMMGDTLRIVPLS